MTDLERRLARLLYARAGQVDTRLDGPALRRAAADRARTRRRTGAQALAAAAAVLVIALAPQLFAGPEHGHRTPSRVPAGVTGVSSVPRRPSTTAPAPTVSPRPTPSMRPTGRPARTRATRVPSPPRAPRTAPVATARPTSPRVYVPPPPPPKHTSSAPAVSSRTGSPPHATSTRPRA